MMRVSAALLVLALVPVPTPAAVRAGREWGCEFVVLQSSPMGFGVYRQMGFEVLTHYAIFR